MFVVTQPERVDFFRKVTEELEHAYLLHGNKPWGRHEFYAVLLEEVEELWEEIKKDGTAERLEEELLQVVAVCLRFYEQIPRN